MFQDKESTFLQKVACHDDIGNLRQIGQGVWRICKDEVKLLITAGQVAEDITTDWHTGLIAQLLKKTFDETVMKSVLLDADNP